MATPDPPLPSEVWALFAGPIDQQTVQRVTGSISTASLKNVSSIHLLFQCTGGGIGEGIALYNMFRALPMDLTIYNSGSVASIGVIAYLGAKKRKTSAHATFMIHRTQTTTQSADTEKLIALAKSAVLFDGSMEAILREHVEMTPERWNHFNHNDLWFSAQEAVKSGLAHEIAEFAPPPQTKLYTL